MSVDVTRHLGLVHRIARRYRWAISASLDFDDLVQAGLLGALRALRTFDPEFGTRESTYVHWWIRSFIRREIANHGRTIRIPVHMAEAVRKAGLPMPCHTVSLDAEIADECTLLDVLAAPELHDPQIPDAPNLTRHERTAVRQCLEGHTLAEVAQAEGVSTQAVSIRRKNAVRKLRAYMAVAS